MMRTHRWIGMMLLAGCSGAMPPATGTPAYPDDVAAALKTVALAGARAEIDRSNGGRALATGVYLDTLVGPTPEAQRFEWAHPRPWLEAMVATRKVDGLFGVPSLRDQLPHQAFAVEVGEPFHGEADTVQIIYAWCIRSFPTRRGQAGPARAWRDLFVRADTGWARVGHRPEAAAFACTP